MDLSSLAGNSRLKEQLSQREEGRGLSHAYIISGPAGSGRHTVARILAAAMVCTASAGQRPCGKCSQCKKVNNSIHPDVITITGEEAGKPIAVDQIRSLRADAHIRPNEGERKIYILEHADQMKDPAQNAMLKLLEEGPKYAAFLLMAGNSGGLLQTVRSRCEQLELVPVARKECEDWLKDRFPGETADRIHSAALDCQGLLGRAVAQLSETAKAKDPAIGQLADALESGSELQLFEASMLLDKKKGEELIRLLEDLETELAARMGRPEHRRQLMRAVELVKELKVAVQFNANPGQVAGWLCAGMFI